MAADHVLAPADTVGIVDPVAFDRLVAFVDPLGITDSIQLAGSGFGPYPVGSITTAIDTVTDESTVDSPAATTSIAAVTSVTVVELT